MHDQPGFLPDPFATSLTLALHFSHAGLLAVPQTCHELSNLRAFDFIVTATWKILPLHSHMIPFLIFFRYLPNVTSSEKSSLKTLFQITPSCTHPISSTCFLFLHTIPNYPLNILCVDFLSPVSVPPESKFYESKDFVLFLDISVVK